MITASVFTRKRTSFSQKTRMLRTQLRMDMNQWYHPYLAEIVFPECVSTQEEQERGNARLTYWRFRLNGRRYYLHRALYELAHGMEIGTLPTEMEIHHKDGNTFNNRLSNLECLHKSEHAALTCHARHNGGYAHV